MRSHLLPSWRRCTGDDGFDGRSDRQLPDGQQPADRLVVRWRVLVNLREET